MNTIDLDQFIKKERLGVGSFAEVYKVQEKETGIVFAAKISKNSTEDESDDELLSLKREVNIMAGINHPAIVAFKGFSFQNFYGEPKPVIITEFLPNGSLADIIQLERLSRSIWNNTLKLINIYGIASAMAYLHSHKICHRDLKPANILMDQCIFPKISDFGLSKIYHQNNESMTMQSMCEIKGTPQYMSPEIWENGEYSNESDVYAFGLIVYEIMTNKIPFEKSDIFSLRTKVVNGQRPEFDIPIPECYQELIENCWDQTPENRPSFDLILEELKNNTDFLEICEDENDFLNYIDYIDECKKSFDSKKSIIQFNDFIKSKSISTSIRQISIDRKSVSRLIKEQSLNSKKRQTSQENPPIKIIESSSAISNNDEAHNSENVTESLQRPITSSKSSSSFQKSKTLNLNENSQDLYIPSIKESEISQTLNSKEKSKPKKFSLFKKSKSKPNFNSNSNNEDNFNNIETENNPEKLFQIGKFYLEEKNSEQGFKYLEKSIKGGNTEAAVYYSRILIKGKITFKDLPKAEKILKKHLKEKDASVYLVYGKLMKKEKKYSKALKYFEKSSKAGNSEAMYNYAKMLFNGLGCDPDKEKAV